MESLDDVRKALEQITPDDKNYEILHAICMALEEISRRIAPLEFKVHRIRNP